MNEFREMKTKDIKPLKEIIWEGNSRKCPVLDIEIPLEKMVLDHAHKRNDEEYSETKGIIRTALDFRVNATLGKLENSLVRTGLNKSPGFDIGTFLRNAADYFESGAYRDNEGNMFVHPNEVRRDPDVSKRNYKRLKKLYFGEDNKAKFPGYPKSGKLTKPLEKLFIRYDISPFN